MLVQGKHEKRPWRMWRNLAVLFVLWTVGWLGTGYWAGWSQGTARPTWEPVVPPPEYTTPTTTTNCLEVGIYRWCDN